MAAYHMRYDREFMRQLEGLPGDIRSMARRQVRDLADMPCPAQAKELEEHPGYYRLWLPREYRLVWQVHEDEQVVELMYVGLKHPDLYKRLGLGRVGI